MKISGVLAWHPHVAMTKDEIDEFLSGRWIARLATTGKDGYPHKANQCHEAQHERYGTMNRHGG